MQRIFSWLIASVSLLALALLAACGGGASVGLDGGSNIVNNPVAADTTDTADQPTATTWPAGLPEDRVEPWESLDGDGYVVPGGRSAAGINADSEFTPGVERQYEGGSVADNGEAAALMSGSAGSGGVSYAIYRLTLGGVQPGTFSADINLHPRSDGSASEYWLGLSDFADDEWFWEGPFSDNHVRVNTGDGDYLNNLGNTFVAVVAFDGSSFDIVGVSANLRDAADTTAPPVPSAPVLTPVDGGLLVEWLPVAAGDLAGYIVYYRDAAFGDTPTAIIPRTDYIEGGTRHLLTGLSGMQYVRVSAIDVSGNESLASEVTTATPLTGASVEIIVSVDNASGMVGDVINLTAGGADSYDFDIDGDGVFDITGNLTGTATVDTNRSGVIRPKIRGNSGTAVALGAVSLVLTSNSRPVASAYASPASGIAPLDVQFGANVWDFDGSVEEYWWDIDGDSVWDYQYVSPDGPNPPLQTFTSPGTYNVKLRVYDDMGAWDVDTITVNVKRGQWENSLPDMSPGNGYFPSAVIVDGMPAVAYYMSGPAYLGFVRAKDEFGTEWDTPMAIVADSGAGAYPALAVIAGNPAVAYYHSSTNEIQYIRADDAMGSSWSNPPVVLETGVAVSEMVTLAQVNGNPAVAYATTGELHYIRADSMAGTGDTAADWGSPAVVVDPTGTVGGWPSLAIIAGNPAIGYYNSFAKEAMYIRAVTSTGQTGADWPGAPLTISGATSVGGYTNLVKVNGHPAMCYFEDSVGSLQFIRALTPQGATGADWPAGSVTVDTGSSAGLWCSMALVDGHAAIAYTIASPFQALCYSTAQDLNGTSWTSRNLAQGSPSWASGYWNDLIDVMGQPFIANYNTTAGLLQCTTIPAQ